jgi:hypothetical protein
MMFSDSVIRFLTGLEFSGSLPDGITVLNPYRNNPEILRVIVQFYHKFYNDNNTRHLILGINPGRFGAGVTGIPFTDTKRLSEKCGLTIPDLITFETSSVFIYDMIEAFGGVRKFYNKFFISAVCPLGFTAVTRRNSVVNYNYYDSKQLTEAVLNFVIENLKLQLEFGIERDICFCLGTGKNYKFLLDINNRISFFGNIVPLEHPRYIMQYKTKKKSIYIKKYIRELQKV